MASHKHHTRHKAATNPNNLTFIHTAVIPSQMSESRTGVPASVTIAQAILESGWGKHHIGSANNYFGVKAHTVKGKIDTGSVATAYIDVSTREHIKGKDITVVDHFRAYKDMTDSFVDHGLFLAHNPRYSAALANYAKTGDADQFARGLQTAGYATDPHYAELLIRIMKQYNLYSYNRSK